MKTLFTKLMTLAMVGIMGLSISSCTEEDLGPGTSNNNSGADSVAFTALNSTSIKVRWVRDSADVGPDTVVATPVSGGTTVTAIAASNVSTATLIGLQKETTYNIQVKGNGGVSSTGQWATAYRLPQEAGNGDVIRLYETADPAAGHPSGLVISPVINQTGALSINDLNAKSLVDVVLSSRTGIDPTATEPWLALIAADVEGSGFVNEGRKTAFADQTYFVAGGLDNDFYGTDIIPGIRSTSDPSRANLVSIDNDVHTGESLIIPFRTVDNYYGRLEVVPQSNGKLYGVSSNGKFFVDVRLSLQTKQGLGYVSRPIPESAKYGPIVKGRPANKPIHIRN